MMEKQAEQKKAIVLDTNFVIQHLKDFDQALNKLNEKHSVYISQISVDERIAQKVRDMKKQYKELERVSKTESRIYSEIVFTKTIEEAETLYRNAIKMNYVKLFPDRIIPFSTTKKSFDCVLKRAFDKTPPFTIAEGASDKGFKDTLIWLSVLDYFKAEGEDEVIFMTDDSIFAKNFGELKSEFSAFTGKTIEFKSNTYYIELTKTNGDLSSPMEPEKQETLPDVSFLRKEIDDAYEAIIILESEDYYGNPRWDRTFAIYDMVNESYAKAFFDGLRNRIQSHMLEAKVFPSELLSVGNVEIVDKERISMERFEAVLKLYESVERNYPQYLDSLYLAFAQKINENYEVKPFSDISADDLPF